MEREFCLPGKSFPLLSPYIRGILLESSLPSTMFDFPRRSSLHPSPSLPLSLVPGRYLSTMRWKRSDRAGKQKTNRTGRTMNTLWTLFSTMLANAQTSQIWLRNALAVNFIFRFFGPMNSILLPLIFRLFSLLIPVLFSFFPSNQWLESYNVGIDLYYTFVKLSKPRINNIAEFCFSIKTMISVDRKRAL